MLLRSRGRSGLLRRSCCACLSLSAPARCSRAEVRCNACRARQYPNYAKPSIPPLLAARQAARAKSVPASKLAASSGSSAEKSKDSEPDAKPQTQEETFAKSQAYGKDKARYEFLSGLYHQLITTASLYFDLWAKVWDVAGGLIAFAGFGGEYVVSVLSALCYTSSALAPRPRSTELPRPTHAHPHPPDPPQRHLHLHTPLHLRHHYPPTKRLPHIRPRSKTRLQQNNPQTLRRRHYQSVASLHRDWGAVPRAVFEDIRLDGRGVRTGYYVASVRIPLPSLSLFIYAGTNERHDAG